jgi:hypothetical protein
MNIKPLLTVAVLALTGCGAHGLTPAAPVRSTSPIVARAEAAVTAAELAAKWDRPQNEGRRVSLKASFVPHTYTLGYGETCQGYRLQGPEGGAVLCSNVYHLTSPTGEEWHDFASAARATLLGHEGVAVRGVFHCSRTASSHGGVYTVPASVEVLTIDEQPLQAYMGRSQTF